MYVQTNERLDRDARDPKISSQFNGKESPSETFHLSGFNRIGRYKGEKRYRPDGRFYQWIQGVDGLSNPVGFWNFSKLFAKAKKTGQRFVQCSRRAGSIGVTKAVKRNPFHAKDKGWGRKLKQIQQLIATKARPNEKDFAYAVARWQCGQRLKLIDGIIGRNTWKRMQNLLPSKRNTVGPNHTSTGTANRPSLADFESFSRSFVRGFIAQGRKIDCADLAIELWIRFSAHHGIPISFRHYDHKSKRLRTVRSSNFATTDSFVKFMQRNLSALGLNRNTYPVPGGHRAAVSGDVFLWKYFRQLPNRKLGKPNYIGHTQIIDKVTLGPNQQTDQLCIVQGTLPPAVPEFYRHNANYFYQPRYDVSINHQKHIGKLLGDSPRRFKCFKGLK